MGERQNDLNRIQEGEEQRRLGTVKCVTADGDISVEVISEGGEFKHV